MSKKIIQTLKQDLLRGGVSNKHVDRYIRELQNHYEDLLARASAIGFEKDAATRWAQKELGDPDVLVNEMISKPELQSYGSRYPKLVFLVLPALLFILIFVSLGMMFVGVMENFFAFSESNPESYREPGNWLKTVVVGFQVFLMHLLAPVLSIIFMVYGFRHHVKRRLLFGGILAVNLLACATLISIQWPDPAVGVKEGSVGVSLGYGLIFTTKAVLTTKIRLLMTLLPLSLFAWSYRQTLSGQQSPIN